MAARYDAQRAIQFLSFVSELPLRIHEFGGQQLTRAAKVVQRFQDQNLTLADAHGLVVMSENRIRTCWSTDRHLGLMGAELVIHPQRA